MAVEHNQVLGRELGAALEQRGWELVAVLGGQAPGGARGESVYDWTPAFIPDEDDWEGALPVFDEDDWEAAEEDQLRADQPLPRSQLLQPSRQSHPWSRRPQLQTSPRQMLQRRCRCLRSLQRCIC